MEMESESLRTNQAMKDNGIKGKWKGSDCLRILQKTFSTKDNSRMIK